MLINETYVKLLEDKLKLELNLNIEVINFGVYGYNIDQISEFYKFKVEKYDPDLVMYGYFPNDPKESFNCEVSLEEKKRFIAEQKPLVKYFFVKRTKRVIHKLLYDEYLEHILSLHSDEYFGWHCTKKQIHELSSQNTTFVLFVIPILTEYDVMDRKIYSKFGEQTINYFDLPYYFETNKGEFDEKELYAKSHYSPATYNVFSLGIAEYLLENKFIPKQ